jgi:hypothetical protein
VTLNSVEGWVYTDSAAPDEVVVSASAPCQLLGIGLCGTVGAFTVKLEVSEVLAALPPLLAALVLDKHCWRCLFMDDGEVRCLSATFLEHAALFNWQKMSCTMPRRQRVFRWIQRIWRGM